MTVSYGRIILDGIEPALDPLGKPYVSSLLYFYLTGTDTLATIFGTATGTVPCLNPQTSDSAGRFYTQTSTFWADSSQAYDLNVVNPDGSSRFYANCYTLGAGVNTSEFLQNPSPALTGAPTAPTPTIGANNSQIATMAALSQALAAQVTFPSGMICLFAMGTLPAGWFICHGQVVSRTTYANLFAAIGVVFGAGDGSTTFQLPDLGGYFARGWAPGQTVDAGRSFGSYQTDEFQGHLHAPETGATNFIYENGSGTSANVTVGGANYFLGNETSTPIGDGMNGSPRTGTETRPINIALIYGIKT